jgi:hypothetical protein
MSTSGGHVMVRLRTHSIGLYHWPLSSWCGTGAPALKNGSLDEELGKWDSGSPVSIHGTLDVGLILVGLWNRMPGLSKWFPHKQKVQRRPFKHFVFAHIPINHHPFSRLVAVTQQLTSIASKSY